MHYLWRAIDQEGEVLESYVTKARDKKAALRFMKKGIAAARLTCRDHHRQATIP